MRSLLTAAVLALAPTLAHAQSAYGCGDLSVLHGNAAIEGRDGVFYRVVPDMQTFHPFSDEIVARIAALSESLGRLGTTLVYAPVPTKSLGMPRHLTAETADLGFDPDLAATLYEDGIRRLEEVGVAAVNLRQAFAAGQTGAFGEALPYHHADPRWTARGGQLAAQAVASRIMATEDYGNLPTSRFSSRLDGTVEIDSAARSVLQRHCRMTLPAAATQAFATDRAGAAPARTGEGGTIFAGAAAFGQIAVVGTEYAAEPTSNFAGFLAEATGLETVQHAIPGGGGFTSIGSYLTSDEFEARRPAYLVWEVPIWENLARFGDQPMAELAAAASGACRMPLDVTATRDPMVVRVDLRGVQPGVSDSLYLDTGTTAAEARFAFRSRGGAVRTKSVVRQPGPAANGRFYVSLAGLWSEGAEAVEIILDTPVGGAPRAAACFS